ncbi:cellulose synthase complex periplasmic endoglucanase BcsZ [Paraburkholderia strydomiana]
MALPLPRAISGVLRATLACIAATAAMSSTSPAATRAVAGTPDAAETEAAACAEPAFHAFNNAGVAESAVTAVPADWPGWEQFRREFISPDGRVIDVGSDDDRTVSEGQSYGLFFALVANDRVSFDRVLRWTENNLAAGDLTNHLPAWLWGRGTDGKWDVLDSNAASDADLWIAYALVEAGRVWNERSYTARGASLAKRVLDSETSRIPALGLTLLPGPVGFHPLRELWRVNPSYTPVQVLRGLAAALPADRRWQALIDSSAHILIDTAQQGFSPDWALYRTDKGFLPDDQTHAESAYNAIRVYLWVGMLHDSDPLSGPLLSRFAPFARYIAAHGAPPERIDTTTAKPGANDGNAGFSAAAIPFLIARGETSLANQQAVRIEQLNTQTPPGYYTSVLTLFGLGWRDGRYRFAANGSLDLPWSPVCGPGRL